ncbi:ParA family protein [Candidatus Woesearchaeota archaeon]|nr:ParA family protein [Candidatus Woesearchaeota archaeon]
MCKIISLINMKGGVGKSTLTVNLAWHLAGYEDYKKNVLVVDLDPQFNASQYLVGTHEYHEMISNEPTVWDIFEQHTRIPTGKRGTVDPDKAIRNVEKFHEAGRDEVVSRIDILPSRLELSLSLKNPAQKATLLAKFLNKIKENYDVILIDCAPTESMLTTSAYLSSDYVLVPVKPEYLSTIGLPLLVNSMKDFKDEYEEKDLKLLGIVYNACTNYSPEEDESKNGVNKLAKKHGWYIFDSEIPYSKSYPKGAREGEPIFRTSYARTKVATEFKKFADEFAKRIDL